MARNGRFCRPPLLSKRASPVMTGIRLAGILSTLQGAVELDPPLGPVLLRHSTGNSAETLGQRGPERFPHISPVASLVAGKDGVCGLMADGQHYPEDTWGKP